MAHVSVIIPTYNRAHCLTTAIESVLNQSYKDVDLIVVDDGSSDGTAALIEQYLRSTHPLKGSIQYLYQGNQGKSAALNHALSRTTGEWIAFLDSDDEWLPDKLERQFSALQRYPASVACFTDFACMNNPSMDTTGFQFHRKQFQQRTGELPATAEAILHAPFVSIVTLLCRATLIDKVGAFDPYLSFTEDYDFIFRLALQGDFCFVNMPLVKVDRSIPAKRHTGKSAIWDDIEFRLTCEQYRYEKWLGLINGSSGKIRTIIKNKLSSVHSSWANEHIRRDDYERAASSIVKASRYRATPNLAAKWVMTRFCPSLMKTINASRRGFNTEYF